MSSRVKVKICGIRDEAAAKAAAAGADYLGFIMCPRFWRYIPIEMVQAICQAVPQPQKIGVFVDQPIAEVAAAAKACQLDFVQLHGHETAEYAAKLRRELTRACQGTDGTEVKAQIQRIGIIKAFRYGEDFSPQAANAYPADYVLIDSYSKNSEGGNGISFAWQAAAEEIRQVTKPYFIAGGIAAATVQEAIKIFHPYGVDASSSMEMNKQKQPELIREFLVKAGKL